MQCSISCQVVDIPNEIAKSGHIYFPEFCKLVLDRFRQILTVKDLTIVDGLIRLGRAGLKTICFGKTCSRFISLSKTLIKTFLLRWCAAQIPSQKILRPKNTGGVGKQTRVVVVDHSRKDYQRCRDRVMLRLEKHALNKEDFAFIMRNLPVPVAESDIDEMFEFADKNQDGKLSFAEFEIMVVK